MQSSRSRVHLAGAKETVSILNCQCSSSDVLIVFCSGPAKGYIEGLEHRLRETESLLLQVLPVVQEDYLEAVTTDPEGSSARSTTTPRRPILNNKTGVEYWEQFPLDSIDNIRRWQQDCCEGRSPYHNSAQSSEERLPPANLEMDPIAHIDQPLSQYQQSAAPSAEGLMSRDVRSIQNVPDWSGANTTTASGMFVRPAASTHIGMGSWNQVENTSMQGQLLQDSSKVYPGQFEPDRPEDSSATPLYPTDFQRQFFW